MWAACPCLPTGIRCCHAVFSWLLPENHMTFYCSRAVALPISLVLLLNKMYCDWVCVSVLPSYVHHLSKYSCGGWILFSVPCLFTFSPPNLFYFKMNLVFCWFSQIALNSLYAGSNFLPSVLTIFLSHHNTVFLFPWQCLQKGRDFAALTLCPYCKINTRLLETW